MRDYSLPGYKYLGPGNKLNKGKPKNKNDKVAYIHDVAYDNYIKRGQNPYFSYNDADRQAEEDFTDEDYGGFLGKRFFAGKRLASQAGFIKNLDGPAHKKLRGSIEPSIKKLAKAKDLSLNNLLTQTNMSRVGDGNASGSGESGNLKETPVDPIPRYIAQGPEDYTFARLPFTAIKLFRTNDTISTDYGVRMTSPYDPEMFTSTQTFPTSLTKYNTITGDPDGGTNVKANWFEFYAGIYKYYHVAKCNWSVYIENLGGEPLYVHQMYINDELPPPEATNTDMMGWEGVRTKILQSQYKSINSTGSIDTAEMADPTFNDMNQTVNEDDGPSNAFVNYRTGNHIASNIGKPSCSFSGSYTPGQYRREVNLDNLVENWTTIDTNPALPERLLLRFKPENPAYNAATLRGDALHFKLFFKVDYIVEFKELKAGLKWPVQRQPMLVTLQTSGTAVNS
jgi:hypothetical protein